MHAEQVGSRCVVSYLSVRKCGRAVEYQQSNLQLFLRFSAVVLSQSNKMQD